MPVLSKLFYRLINHAPLKMKTGFITVRVRLESLKVRKCIIWGL